MKEFLNETLCLICAKGNSQGLKNKNIKKINKKTLIEIAFKKAEQNKLKFFCLSTESQKIRKIAKSFGLRSFFTRSKYLTDVNISKLDVWKDALIKSEKFYDKKFKYILDIEVTNPLTTKKDLNDFIKFFLNNINKSIDGCLCVHE
jgi:CMP-N,N'-diacetyllegionaminic acid synthase